jgi:cytochrome c oxidase subunit 2
MATRALRARAWAPAAAAALLTACSEYFPQTTLDPKSDFAREIDGLYRLVLYLGLGVAVLVFVVLTIALVRFRYRPGGPPPSDVAGNARLEIAWTLIPSVLLAIVAVPTVRTIFASYAPAPANALKIDVYGWQWWWEFRYVVGKDTIRTANEVHVPVGRPVELRLHGGDVLHSFWIPKMGGKRDVIPNRVNRIVFTAEEPGVYLGQCAEFCGDSHALMKMRLIAHTPENFERWLRHEASPALPVQDSAIAIGQQIFLQRCIACHMVRGTQASIGRVGPDLTHVASRGTIAAGVLENNAANLVRWIDNPQAVKPGAKMPRLGLTPQELRFVVAYLQTLY